MSATKVIAVPDLEKTLTQYQKLHQWVSIFSFVLLAGTAGAMVTITWDSLGTLSLVLLLPICIGLFVINRKVKKIGLTQSIKIWQSQGQKGREFIVTADELQVSPLLVWRFSEQDPLFRNGYLCLPWQLISDFRLVNGSKNSQASLAIELKANNRWVFLNRPFFMNIENQVMEAIQQNITKNNPELAQEIIANSAENNAYIKKTTLITTCGALVLVSAIALFLFTNYVNPLNTIVFFLLLSLPAAFLFYKIFGAKIIGESKRFRTNLLVTSFPLFFIPVPFLALILISRIPNGEVSQELVVVEKFFTRGSKGSVYYYVTVPLTLDQQRSLTHSSGAAEISISRREYEQVIPNASKVNLRIGYGALRTPFIMEKNFSHPPANHANANSNEPTHGADPNYQQRLEAARAWVAEPVRTPANAQFREERWPNGALKEKVPHLNGQAHGVGHYWFDNGTPYGQIPWKNGQKHGRFRLHRADGTLEQELSYQEGQPHGWLRWYDASGKLQQERTYEHGKVID